MSNMPLADHLHTISSHSSDINGVCFSSSVLATCSGDKTVRVWSTDDFSELPLSPLCGHTYPVYRCEFSPFGTLLASCSMDGCVILWNAKTGEKKAVLQHPSKTSIRTCKFSPNSSMIVSGSDDNTLCLWEVASGRLLKTLAGHDESVVACGFSPDGNYLVSGSPAGDLKIWDGQYGHGKCLTSRTDAHDLGVSCCEFSPSYVYGTDMSRATQSAHYILASAGQDENIILWEVLTELGSSIVTMNLRDTLTGHTAEIMSITFSRDGALLASGSGDKTVRLWDTAKGESVQVIEGHNRYVTCCAFSLDGKLLATGSNDRSVKVWRIITESLLTDDAVCDDDLIDLNEDNLPGKKSIEKWTIEDVASWVEEIGLAQYKDNFMGNAIDGTELITLTQDSLEKSIGITALGYRNKVLRAIRQVLEHPIIQRKDPDSGAPDEYLCPITREIMREPVIASDGYTYEKCAIESWVKSGKCRSPMTNAPLPNFALTPNRSLKMLIQRHLQDSC